MERNQETIQGLIKDPESGRVLQIVPSGNIPKIPNKGDFPIMFRGVYH